MTHGFRQTERCFSSTMNTAFGAALKKLRLGQKLSGEDLAAEVGINQGSISRYETGKTTPKPETIIKIAEVLETSPAPLLRAAYLATSDADPLDLEVAELMDGLTPSQKRSLIDFASAMRDKRQSGESRPASPTKQ